MDDKEAAALTLRATAGAVAASAATVDPGLGITLAILPPVLDEGIKKWQASQARATARALDVAADASGLEPKAVVDRLTADPARLLLLGEAINAAARSSYDERICALGRALATGALAVDGAKVDEERLWVEILADIEAPHLRMLEYLMRDHPDRTGSMVTQQPTLARVAGVSYPMARVLLATLERRNLARWRWGESFPKGYIESAGASASEQWWQRDSLTPLLMDRFREAADLNASTNTPENRTR
jgi:hypothetical protein